MPRLAALFSSAAARMSLDLRDIRTASEHAGLKGTGAEEVVAAFLKTRLPASLGVTAGHVIDAEGKASKQADVIMGLLKG